MKKSLLITLLGVLSISLANAQTLFSCGFESEDEFNQWVSVDADGDGYNWTQLTGYSSAANNGEGVVYSESYNNEVGELEPDNWLISPLITLNGELSFYAKGSNSAYCWEHFAVYVYVPETTPTSELFDAASFNASSFNAISEEIEIESASYEKFSFDLFQFEGKKGYIAIRHFNCTDQYRFFLDDVLVELVSNPAPKNVFADNITDSSADIYWEASSTPSSFNIHYRKNIAEGFESGTLNGWTAVDADGDGYNWMVIDSGSSTPHSGDFNVTSASYNTSGALTPDNWLISPQVTLGGSLSFWVCGQDPDWAEEVFAVYVSTTGTEISDFQPLTDDMVSTGEYEFISIDLSNYSGQGYVAIRHYNISDMFRLNIDDITILGPGESNEWIELPSTTEKQVSLEDLEALTEYEVEIQAVFEDGVSSWTYFTFITTGDIVVYADDVNGQNSSLIENQDGNEVPSITIDGLTLENDGKYHTISLPFDLDAEALAASPLAGATLKEISSYTEEDGVFKVFFTDATEIVANHVYFYKWTGETLENPKFENVTIDLEKAFYWTFYDDDHIIAATGTYYNILVGDDYYFAFDDENQYFFLTDSTNGTTIKAFDGIFQFKTNLEEADAIFEEESDIPTGISEVTAKSNGTWFNAQGVKLNAKPAQKGVYVSNGKKFVVK